MRAPQVVQRHCLFAAHAGVALRLQRTIIDMYGLRVVAHPVVEDGDGIERGQRVIGEVDLFENRLRSLEIAQAGGVVPLHSEQVAA